MRTNYYLSRNEEFHIDGSLTREIVRRTFLFDLKIHFRGFGLVDSDQVTWPLPPSGKARSQGLSQTKPKYEGVDPILTQEKSSIQKTH